MESMIDKSDETLVMNVSNEFAFINGAYVDIVNVDILIVQLPVSKEIYICVCVCVVLHKEKN